MHRCKVHFTHHLVSTREQHWQHRQSERFAKRDLMNSSISASQCHGTRRATGLQPIRPRIIGDGKAGLAEIVRPSVWPF
jgi:hypothetical protein